MQRPYGSRGERLLLGFGPSTQPTPIAPFKMCQSTNIVGVLSNTKVRLKAAKVFSQRLSTAMEGINKEIERLQQQQ